MKSMQSFAIIAAMDEKRGIGKENQLPWHLPSDLKHFAELTRGTVVIMGRKTWESLPEKHRPLKGRLNMVLSRSRDLHLGEEVLLAQDLEAAFAQIEQHFKGSSAPKVFVIGGATLYAEAIHHSYCTELFLTEVKGEFNCDAFFPELPQDFELQELDPWQKDAEVEFRFLHWIRKSAK